MMAKKQDSKSHLARTPSTANYAAVPRFGAANVPVPELQKTRRLLVPRDLPSKGIYYHINHVRRLWSRGQFPKPISISARRFAWTEEAIDKWIDEKISASASRVE